jgi:hypothetical protein
MCYLQSVAASILGVGTGGGQRLAGTVRVFFGGFQAMDEQISGLGAVVPGITGH